MTCSGASGSVFIDGFVRQRKGRVFIDGFFFTQVECSGETAWSAELIGGNGLFTGGRVDVEAFAFAEDEDGFAQDSTTVRLRGKR